MSDNIPRKPKGISINHEGRVANCPSCSKLVREEDKNCNKCNQVLKWD